MELNIHELIKKIIFFGVRLNNFGNHNPVIVSINERGETEVTVYEELTEAIIEQNKN